MGWKSTIDLSRERAISEIISLLDEATNEEVAEALEALSDRPGATYFGHNFCITGMNPGSREWVERSYPHHAHTWDWDDHPGDYEDVCFCRTCRSGD